MKHPETISMKNSDNEQICGEWNKEQSLTCSRTHGHMGDHMAYMGHSLISSLLATWHAPATQEEVDEAIASILNVRRE